MVNEGTNDRDFTAGIFSDNSTVNGQAMNVETLESCFNERIDREMSNIVDSVEDRIRNAILTAFDKIIAPKVELAIRSRNASSGRDATSVSANSESRKYAGVDTPFENSSGNNNTLGMLNVNDETRHNIHDEVSELLDPGTRFNRQSHTHHMVTGQTAQTTQFPEFLTGRTLPLRNSPSQQCRNLFTQVSQDNKLPMVEQTPRNQNSDANNSINRLADAIAGIATQQRPQAARMLKPVSTNTLNFVGKNEKFELFEDLFHTMLKMQPEMTETMKINHFHAHLRKEALETFRNISASNKKTLDDVLNVFRRKYVKPESQTTAKHKWHKLTFDPNTKSLPDFLEEFNECAQRASGDNAQHMIDSLLYATLPHHLKRSLNLAYLENGTYDQIVAHLERELELSGLENDGELTIPTMTATPPNDNHRNTEHTKVVCHHSKKSGHVIRDCRERMRKEQEQRIDPSNQSMTPSTFKSFASCRHSQRTNHPPEKCLKGRNAANRPKRFKQEYSVDKRNDGQDQGNLTHPGLSSILKHSFN